MSESRRAHSQESAEMMASDSVAREATQTCPVFGYSQIKWNSSRLSILGWGSEGGELPGGQPHMMLRERQLVMATSLSGKMEPVIKI